MIAIVDYGMSNMRSVRRGLEAAGAAATIVDDPKGLEQAGGIVLPGDGAFGQTIQNLSQGGWIAPMLAAIRRGVPFLGICLGMQLLFETSEEMGEHCGLGILRGRVKKFHSGKVPQIGWNQLIVNPRSRMLRGVQNGTYAYFVHSYFCEPEDSQIVTAETEYGISYASVVEQNNLWATQFHPEKSGPAGLVMLRNFARANDHLSCD
jgi:glutamine amidotransferase